MEERELDRVEVYDEAEEEDGVFFSRSAMLKIADFANILSWIALLVYLSWDALGWKILLLIAAACTAIVLAIVAYVVALIRKGGLSMPATMAELRNDQDALL